MSYQGNTTAMDLSLLILNIRLTFYLYNLIFLSETFREDTKILQQPTD